MKTATLTLLFIVFAAAVSAQPPDRPPRDQSDRPDPAREEDEGPLTAEQKAQVKTILSQYDPAALTSEMAHAINEAFRAAGLRNGPGLQEAIRDAGFEPERIGELDPPPGQAREEHKSERPKSGRKPDARPGADQRGDQGGPPNRRGRGQGGGYSIDQAISDRAQLNTIAFDGLAFLTGDLGSCTFLPPGKVADFCGFQYMRDVDTNELGHNTSFVPRVANNVLYILTAPQKAQLVALAQEQEKLLTDFAYQRFPLIKAFCRQLDGQIPAGSAGLNRDAVVDYTAGLFEIDGMLSCRRAEVLGGIVRALTDKQKQYLEKMAFNDSSTWPELPDQLDKRSMSHTAHVAVMTYASEMFSWYAGNVESDVYFCPERHATYFGAFYMKDIPAMGNPNYSISTSLTGDSGEAFLAALTPAQRELVTNLVDQQRQDLNEIVTVRRDIATLLRDFMQAGNVDQKKVLALSHRYGELDGAVSYAYAVAFAEVAKSLTAEQKKTLLKLRNLDEKFVCQGAYLYSRAIPMPEIPNTDFLFAPPTKPHRTTSSAPAGERSSKATMTLRSPAVAEGQMLPKEFTGDGEAATLPLEWSGLPQGTQSLAIIMHHVAPDGECKWYWILYGIPADTTSLPKNVRGVGTLGNNSVNGRVEYAPPHSKGPGPKTYVYTLYALSAPAKPSVAASQANREALLQAMQGLVLDSAELHVVYSRDVGAEDTPRKPER